MADIKSFDVIFRDNDIEGNTSSPKHKVNKPDVRAALNALLNRTNSIVNWQTADFAIGSVYSRGDGVSSDGSSYFSLADSNSGHDPATSPDWWHLIAAKGDPGSLAASSQFNPMGRVGYTVPLHDKFPSGAYLGFGVAFDPTRVWRPKAYKFWLVSGANLVVCKLAIYKRPRSANSTLAPGQHASDVNILNTSALFVIVPDPTNTIIEQEIVFDVTGHEEYDTNYTYLATVLTYAVDGVTSVSIGWGYGVKRDSVLPAYTSGWTFGGPPALFPELSYGPIAFVVYEAAYDDAYLGPPRILPEVRRIGDYVQRQFIQLSPDISYPKFEVYRADGSTLPIPAGTITVTADGTSTITNEVHSMVGGAYIYLNSQHVESVSVTDSGGTPLVNGTDYVLETNAGTIKGITTVSIKLTYTYNAQHYGVIYVDPITGVVGFLDGASHNSACVELMPDVPAGKLGLFTYRHYRVPGYYVFELQPIHEWRDYHRIGREAEHWALIDRNMGLMGPVFEKCAQGAEIVVALYSDSNGYMGGDNAAFGRRTNGDAPGFVTDIRGNDTSAITAAQPTYTQDGNTKTTSQFSYSFLQALRDMGGRVRYVNCSISGANSGGGTGLGQPHALNPDRIAAMLALNPDVVIYAHGTNDIGGGDMRPNIAALYNTYLKPLGIVMPIRTPLPNNLYAHLWDPTEVPPMDDWLYTSHTMVAAAIELNCPLVPMYAITGPENTGATGINPMDYAWFQLHKHHGFKDRIHARNYEALMLTGRMPAPTTGNPTPPSFSALDARSALAGGVCFWRPRVGGTTIDPFGLGYTATGTPTAGGLASTSFFTNRGRVRFASAASADAACGARGDALACWRGNAAALGGFKVTLEFGVGAFASGCRGFVGLLGSTSLIGSVDPSSLTTMVGVGWDAGQTTLHIMTNDGSGSATSTDLGARFPINNSATEGYRLTLSCKPNGSQIKCRVERLSTDGGDVEGTILTANLPPSTSFLTPHFWMATPSGTAVAIDVMEMLLATAQP